jgi:hypothetical protein
MILGSEKLGFASAMSVAAKFPCRLRIKILHAGDSTMIGAVLM